MAKRKRLTPIPLETKQVGPDIAASPPSRVGPPGAAPVAQVTGEAAGSAALQEMSDYIASARAEGRLAVTLPVSKIALDHMARDRILAEDPAADEDMQALMASLRDRGQQVPIDVVRLGGDPRERYGLVSGLRRVTALRLLHKETQDAQFAVVKARVLKPANLPEAYRSMVEENEIRAGLSFYERAQIAVRAMEAGAYPDLRAALRGLYGNVSRAKRSKIGAFVPLVEDLGDILRFPAALSEKRGLALVKALKADETLVQRLSKTLETAAPDTAEAEQIAIDRTLTPPRTTGAGSAAKQPETRDVTGDAADQIEVRHEDGKIVLTGQGVTAALHVDLMAWLRARR